MEEAIVQVTTFNFSPIKANNQNWITKWEVIKFDWFMKLYIESNDDENLDEDEDNLTLPDIKIWEILVWNNPEATQSYSRPPARYTEASLVKKMEQEWIGRPSTYAPTISTIIDRWYVETLDKKSLWPTEVAFQVNDFLEQYFSKMMQYKFTKDVEEDFDKVAEWKIKYEEMLSDFWENSLKKDLDHAWANAEKVIEKLWKECPKCWADLIYRHSKAWKFIWCSWYPECDFTDQPAEEKDLLNSLKAKYEWKPCPDWVGWTIVIKTWKFWPFLASSEYPKVKWIWKIKDKKEELLEEILQKKWLLIDSETWEELVIKNSSRWPFLAAKNYPKVKIAKNIPKEVWDEVNSRMHINENEWE
jgi:DNA topoisomerase-1